MKKILAICILFFVLSCKKETVVATNTKAFQESINDMSSDLPTLRQVKFNEALYILKKFAVNGNDDGTELKQLAALLEGKNVDQIMALADETASKNGMDWKSNGPPMLGEANIFGNQNAAEFDPNDVDASHLYIKVKNIGGDSASVAQGIRVIPVLTDGAGSPVTFSKATLESVMEVSSAGRKILTTKNFMTDNNFRGFPLLYSSLRRNDVPNGKIDIKVTVKTAKKTLQFIKTGFVINKEATKVSEQKPVAATGSQPAVLDNANPQNAAPTNDANEAKPTETEANTPTVQKDPKTTVTKFLNNLSSKNLKGAYEVSKNPTWGSFDAFSNESSGFGAVNSVSVKNIGNAVINGNAAQVDAVYDVTDKTGKITPLKVTFGLTKSDSGWKISSYKIK